MPQSYNVAHPRRQAGEEMHPKQKYDVFEKDKCSKTWDRLIVMGLNCFVQQNHDHDVLFTYQIKAFNSINYDPRYLKSIWSKMFQTPSPFLIPLPIVKVKYRQWPGTGTINQNRNFVLLKSYL